MNLKNLKDELFKVWDTKNKCFLEINGYDNIISSSGDIFETKSTWNYDESSFFIENRNYDVKKKYLEKFYFLYSTRITDRNKKMIYEKDIVSWEIGGKIKYGIVNYDQNNGYYSVKHKKITNKFTTISLFKLNSHCNVEVIGNIFENKELWKKIKRKEI